MAKQPEFVTILVEEVENWLVVQLVVPTLRLAAADETMDEVLRFLSQGRGADHAGDKLQSVIRGSSFPRAT